MSAIDVEIGQEIGILVAEDQPVAARRYLEHLADCTLVVRRSRYRAVPGGTGRYRAVPGGPRSSTAGWAAAERTPQPAGESPREVGAKPP
ncbi:MAG: hypothetical protein ACYDDU_09800 [Dermatophilaceae bacterium]